MTKNEKNINSMVLVDAELLSQGLKTAFTGIAMVFDSLGASGAADEIKAAQEVHEAQTAPAASAASQVSSEEEESEEAEDLPFDPEPEEPDKPAKPADDKAVPAPSVTIDDITKVIVAKIKKKRDNNARIGVLLKSYGVEKVSSLPPEKYEAFLTDISEL